MKNYKSLLLLAVIFLTLPFASFNTNAAEQGVMTNNIAPDFEVTNQQGGTFKLSNYKGKKPVYLIFWATWCPTCESEIPQFKQLYKDFGERVEILAINADTLSWWGSLSNANKKVNHYIEKHQIPYHVALDENEKLIELYQVMGTPTQILIDKNGSILRRYPIYNEKTEAILKSLL